MSSHKMAPPGHTTSGTWNWRRVRRWAAWTIGAPFALLLLLYLAWALSNLNDATPMPVPTALALPASKVPDERNAAYAVMGLFAAPDSEPDAVGRASWQAELAWAALPLVQGQLAPYPQTLANTSTVFKHISGSPWVCQHEGESCIAQWLTQKDALAIQREQGRVWGARCERLLDGAFEFEEPLPPQLGLAASVLMPTSNLVQCERWFSTGAVLAWASGQNQEALRQLLRANRLRVHYLEGSKTLVSASVAMRVARRVESSFAAIAVRDAALAPQLASLLSPLPDQRQLAARWIPTEAAHGRSNLAAIAHAPVSQGLGDVLAQARRQGLAVADNRSWFERLGDAFDDRLSLSRFSFQLERTTQAMDQLWLDTLGRLAQADLGAATAVKHPPPEGPLGWAWRNAAGRSMVDLATPAFAHYLARHADAELHSHMVALVLALQTQQVPASERESWTQKQDLPTVFKQRLSWADDGRKISAKPWISEPRLGPYDPARSDISVPWPP